MSRHPKSNDDTRLSSATFAAAIDALEAAVKIDRVHDIPYLCGYSYDAKTIYLDRRLPPQMVNRFLVLHETVEKSVLYTYGLKYQLAHQIALQCERAAVLAAGIDWEEYNDEMEGFINAALREMRPDVPDDLDLQPYQDECDRLTLAKILRQNPKAEIVLHFKPGVGQ